MQSPETREERELRPLRMIPDNYEKIVLSMDPSFINSYDGIKSLNLIDWLLQGAKQTKIAQCFCSSGYPLNNIYIQEKGSSRNSDLPFFRCIKACDAYFTWSSGYSQSALTLFSKLLCKKRGPTLILFTAVLTAASPKLPPGQSSSGRPVRCRFRRCGSSLRLQDSGHARRSGYACAPPTGM